MDDELLRGLDWLVVRCDYDNRAEALRDALQRLIKAERDRQIGEQIAESYRRMPQGPDEVIPPDFSVWDRLDDDDWSDWE